MLNLLLGRFLGWAIVAVGAVALIAGTIYHFRHQGYLQAEAKYKPMIEKCTKELTDAREANAQLAKDVLRLQQLYVEQNKSIQELELAEAQALKARDEAMAKLAAREIALRKQINHYAALAAGPPAPTRQESCDEANRILDELAAHRLRD